MPPSFPLKATELEVLSPENFENLSVLLQHFDSEDTRVKMTVLSKISDDFAPQKFVHEFYPLESVINIFDLALMSNEPCLITEALCGLVDVSSELARSYSLLLLDHSNFEIKDEAICCLGYVGKDVDIYKLLAILDSENENNFIVSAYCSLLRLGEFDQFKKGTEIILSVNKEALESLLDGFYTLVELYDFTTVMPYLRARIVELKDLDLEVELENLERAITRNKLLTYLGSLDPSNTMHLDEIIEFLQSTYPDVRFKALSLLGAGAKPNKRAMPSSPFPSYVYNRIKQLSDDHDDEVRAELVSVLGDWEDKSDIPFISQFLFDNSELVRLDALYALGEIGEPIALSYMEKFDFERSTELEKIRYLESKIRLGDKSVFNRWLAGLNHETDIVRAYVAGGVWCIWEKEWSIEIKTKLVETMKNEPYLYVCNEIQDALNFIETMK